MHGVLQLVLETVGAMTASLTLQSQRAFSFLPLSSALVRGHPYALVSPVTLLCSSDPAR